MLLGAFQAGSSALKSGGLGRRRYRLVGCLWRLLRNTLKIDVQNNLNID
jgi:hypothetical protein